MHGSFVLGIDASRGGKLHHHLAAIQRPENRMLGTNQENRVLLFQLTSLS